ncbi:MAG TPA: hypothetical protein VFT06_16450, partial [Flavisolibacter sp.]|nr:hypothetical protein [Flavisolibacter sp.]
MKGKWLDRMQRSSSFVVQLLAVNRVRTTALQAIPFWIASLLTGLIAVGYTKLFGYAEGLLRSVLHWHEWTIFLLAPFCFFLAWFC